MVADLRVRLQARAVRWLAQREHSRTELRTRLLQAVRRGDARPHPLDGRGDGQGDDDTADPSSGSADHADMSQLVEAVLDGLQAQGWLSDQRFVESRVNARQARWGNRRIQHELRQHGLAPDAQQLQALALSERQRARAVWLRRFGQTPAEPAEPAERARQMRFLAARGFSTDAIRDALGAADDQLSPDDADH